MPQRLSELCSRMGRPGDAPKPEVRHADCPEDAAYIITNDAGGSWTVPNLQAFPIVIEGGDGNDAVTIVGRDGAGVLVDGGRGNDQVIVEDRLTWWLHEMGPGATFLLAAFGLILAGIVAIAWRALRTRD